MFLLLSIASATAADLYVSTPSAGADLFLDGRRLDVRTPALVRDLSAGPHYVEVRSGCAITSAATELPEGGLVRVELIPVESPIYLQVVGEPIGARVAMDGIDVGGLPWEGVVACTVRRLTVSAPDYVTAVRELDLEPGTNAWLIYGPLAGTYTLSSTSAWDARFIGTSASDYCGYSSALGDLDADGRMDILIGCPAGESSGSTDFGIVAILMGR